MIQPFAKVKKSDFGLGWRSFGTMGNELPWLKEKLDLDSLKSFNLILIFEIPEQLTLNSDHLIYHLIYHLILCSSSFPSPPCNI